MTKTPKARALGGALRAAREERGLKLRELATKIERDPGILSRWETGERTPKPENVSRILTELGVNGVRYDGIMTLAYRTDEPQWAATTLPEQRQQLAAFLDYEQNATKIIEVAPLLVPGLLQTSGYIRAIMSAGGVPVGDIATRIAVRIGRREVLAKENPAQLVALIGQGVLFHGVGGRSTAVEQVKYLLEMARLPNVDLRIIPYHSGWHPGLEGPFTLIESEQATPVVLLETRRSGLCLHQDGDVNAYREAADMILRVAMNSDESMRLIAEIANRLEKEDG
ncbi:helix-turn-helix domain-containing protein [Saccharopolyspora sp. 5N708]|uniref:helix-turn-helix domain-containing protein n=1 Tax=Saccharopolyspora sp. 5N708 TaxID=3457424 RepID=UPI003FD39888